MVRKEVLVQFSDELLKKADEYASSHEVSRSELVRDAVTEYLARRSAEAKVRQWIDGYERMPLTGEERAQLKANARRLGRRLEDDEW